MSISVDCEECYAPVNGEAKVVAGRVYHPRCFRIAEARECGYAFECPVCHGEPRKYHPAHVDEQAREAYAMGGGGGPGSGGPRDFTVPERWTTCEQCHGRGYVAKEPRQVTTATKWVTE